MAASGCRGPQQERPGPLDMVELLPGVRVNVAERWVEFDGFVPIDVNDPQAPDIYLELLVCSPDTREHETLVVTEVTPSHLHAALLSLGLEPGRPGAFRFEGREVVGIDPAGDRLGVLVRVQGRDVFEPLASWTRHGDRGVSLIEDGYGFVFAGSRMVERQGRVWYDADGAGTIIGLTTFGGEVIALDETISPEAAIAEPVWLADNALVPPFGTPVTVRVVAAD